MKCKQKRRGHIPAMLVVNVKNAEATAFIA